MPYGDGTGPEGRGRMTGRQAGYCTGNDRPGRFERCISFGRERGRGMGRGLRNFAHRGYYPADYGYEREPVKVQEKDALQQQQSWFKNQLDNITRRLSELSEEKIEK
ncbi:MAG: DUF5320 domain-containing protein [Candidatus Stygibacter australis]|nr:DUF5320 domain-containing protein [Candidatus Stygibacter australis]MDP8320796.1 DUF5320 domain-containing protein [Candidatus Stygibacter australis]